jgi:hypothetical protein
MHAKISGMPSPEMQHRAATSLVDSPASVYCSGSALSPAVCTMEGEWTNDAIHSLKLRPASLSIMQRAKRRVSTTPPTVAATPVHRLVSPVPDGDLIRRYCPVVRGVARPLS